MFWERAMKKRAMSEQSGPDAQCSFMPEVGQGSTFWQFGTGLAHGVTPQNSSA